MRVKWIAALLLLAVTNATSLASEKPADLPSIVLRVQSLNALLQNLNLVVKLVGQEAAANQIEGLIKGKIGKQGLEGIDLARPFGAYVRFGKAIDDITGAILIPIADQKTVLTRLGALGIKVTLDKDGIYTHQTDTNFQVHFRFANEYLYLTSVNTQSIQVKNLPDPVKALAIANHAMISLVARIDQIPSDARLIALAQLEATILAGQKKNQPNETKIQEEFRIALLREVNRYGSSLVRDAVELRFDLDVNDKTRDLSAKLSITGKPGSDLAKSIQALASQQSSLINLGKTEAAFQGSLHLALPEGLNKAFAAVIDEAAENGVEGIQNAQKKKQAEALFKAIMPTAKSGDFHLVGIVLGPEEKKYSFVTAMKLKEGEKLGKTVHDLVKLTLDDIPANLRDKIQLNFASVGNVQIHKFELQKNPIIDKLLDEVVSENQLYLAFREDALFLAIGKEALPTLKTILAKQNSRWRIS